jgi:hypothetical protein
MANGRQNRRQFLGKLGAAAGAAAGMVVYDSCARKEPEGKPLVTYDLTYTLKLERSDPKQRRRIYDHSHFVSSLQGLVNRREPRLYIFLMGPESAGKDEFWLRKLPPEAPTIDHYWLRYLREEDKWLADYRLEPAPDLPALVSMFRSEIPGIVVYDERVPATSNVASTVAGAENLLCVRFDQEKDSLFQWLTADPNGPKIPVKVWLVNRDGTSLFTGKGKIPGSNTPSTGSAKGDAYLWAKENYLDTGKSNPAKMGYYLDAFWLQRPEGYIPDHKLTNHDYFISHRGFFFDLSPWGDEAPNDDPTQPVGTDLKTMQAILRAAWERTGGKRMIHIGGFPPVDKGKYTKEVGGKHEGVPTEWHFAEVYSCFNAYMDADIGAIANMANASVYQHYPLEAVYPQKLPTVEDLKTRGYITAEGNVAPKFFACPYVGDYDSTGWIYQRIPDLWGDPARGTIPLGWAFNPNLSDRFGPGMVYVRRKKSSNDYFVAGDSGAGYVNPGNLLEPRKWSGLPSGLDVWTEHCKKYFKLWDISITGFIIDGYAPPTGDKVEDAYAEFSQNGIGLHFWSKGWGVHKGMPYIKCEEAIQYHNPEESARLLLKFVGRKKPDFLYFRTILMTPSEHKQLFDLVKASPQGKDVEFVDPYTLFLLIKEASAGRA